NNELVSVNDSFSGLKKGNGRPYDKAMFCYRQDRNLLWGASGMCQHCNQSMKTVKILKKRSSKCVISRAEMHKQPTPPLKQVNNQEDDEPITNTNKELELEEEIEVVKMEEEIEVVKMVEEII
ncbi:hypothetical protein CWI37_1032p0010, partial [Hamiltosporidium tvaerminnensis]